MRHHFHQIPMTVMVAVVNVLELFTCTKCEGAAGGDSVDILYCGGAYFKHLYSICI